MREADFLPWNQEQWQLSLFVLEQHSRGSSVPKSSLQALQWLCGKVRLDIGANEEEVKATAIAAQPSLVKQAVPVTVRVWLTLESALASANALVAGLAAIWILMIITSVRFVHIQRSSIVRVTTKTIIFYCSRSSTKRGGSRHPFLWACPRVTLLEKTDLLRVMKESLGLAPGPLPEPDQPSWLLADFGPR